MGPGHLGVGLAVKPLVPKAPLWALLVASETIDLLSFGLVATGVERMGVYQVSLAQGLQLTTPGWIPWSHGLFMSLVWSCLAAGLAYLFFRERRISAVVGGVVFSHWIIDLITHTPDLPIFFAKSPLLGLGLWGSGLGFIISIVLELVFLGGGFAIYWQYRKQTARLSTGNGSVR